MTEQKLIKAPDGWLDYAAGKHFEADSPAVLESAGDYLSLLKRLDLGLVEAGPLEAEAEFSWLALEHAAIKQAEDGHHWRARFSALTDLQSLVTKRQSLAPDTQDLWAEKVAEGRYYLNFAEATQRGGETDVFKSANAYLAQADEAFTGIEGEDFFRAQGEVIRGRLRAWKNDVIGATASQSSALSVFQKYGNKTREAAAAYELAIANLDANLPDPALRLFDLAISAHRNLNTDGAALARALQSKARALLAKARLAGETDNVGQFISEAQQHAYEALTLSAPTSSADEIQKLAPGQTLALSNALSQRDAYRAGMAARDLGDATLMEIELGLRPRSEALEQARGWLRVTATELGLGEVFSENGRQSIRQKIRGTEHVSFAVLRAAQLEFEILAQTDPAQAGPLLIEVGKLHSNKNYAVECFEAAARCFETEASREDDALQANEAVYWRHRAARLALSIGMRSDSDAAEPSDLSELYQSAFSTIRDGQDLQIVRYETVSDMGLHAEVIVSGRQTISRLAILPPAVAKSINLDLLLALADRGDIPQILVSERLKSGALYLVQEIPVGRRLSETMAADMSDDMRIRLCARLCRTLASLIRAHSADSGASQPLYVTFEDIMVDPGNRSVITSFGPIGRKQAPSLGWSFLYPKADPSSSKLKDGLDAQALAKMIVILLGEERVTSKNLSFPSYVRRALGWFVKKKPMDQLSFEATSALSKFAKGDLHVARSYEKSLRSEEQIGKREVEGVSALLKLASLLDSAANKS